MMLGTGKEVDPLIVITADGSCACYAVGVTLCTALLQDPTLEINPIFLEKMHDFHPQFNPATKENLLAWIKTYGKTKRDMELLVGPVLRYWYESEKQSLTKEEALNKLPSFRPDHLDDEAIKWICNKLQLNLKQTARDSAFTFDVLFNFAKRPKVHAMHSAEAAHFDLKLGELSPFFQENILQSGSFILSRNKDVDHAWDYQNAPLEQPSPDVEAQVRAIVGVKTATPVKPVVAKSAAAKPAAAESPKPILPLFDSEKDPETALMVHLNSAIKTENANNRLYFMHGYDKALLLTANNKEAAMAILAKTVCGIKIKSTDEKDIAVFQTALAEELRQHEARSGFNKKWRS